MIFNGKMPIGTKSMTNKVLTPHPLLPLLLPLPVAMSAGALRGIAWEDCVTPHPHPSNESNIG